MTRSLRPRHADDLGLRRALSDRLLPLLVAAMVFLAALALAGVTGAAALAARWQAGAAAVLTVQVPQPGAPAETGGTRGEAALAALRATRGVLEATPLPPEQLRALIAPWLGTDPKTLGLKLPAVYRVTLAPGAAAEALDTALARLAPGTVVERNGAWADRLAALARSLQACAALALLVVGFVAASVIAIATRAGIAARRDAVEIVHGLGATDRTIAGQFARRVTALAAGGAMLGAVLALPVLLGLAQLSAPFRPGAAATPTDLLQSLPPALWAALALMPAAAALIGWVTAQATVRGWLARLP